mgnify:CR=1 FL=1
MEFADPAGQYAFNVVLPQPKPITVSGREAADVERYAGESRDLGDLSLSEEPISDSSLVENLAFNLGAAEAASWLEASPKSREIGEGAGESSAPGTRRLSQRDVSQFKESGVEPPHSKGPPRLS